MLTEWTITEDRISSGRDVGVVGPYGAKMTMEEIQAHPESKKFRMLDDDDEVYYVGYVVPGRDYEGFEPLNDFGAPNAGCTYIQYWEKGGWETL